MGSRKKLKMCNDKKIYLNTDRGPILVIKDNKRYKLIQKNLIDVDNNFEEFGKYEKYFNDNSVLKVNVFTYFDTILNNINLRGKSYCKRKQKIKNRRYRDKNKKEILYSTFEKNTIPKNEYLKKQIIVSNNLKELKTQRDDNQFDKNDLFKSKTFERIEYSDLIVILEYKINNDISNFNLSGNTKLTLSDIDKLKNIIKSIANGYGSIVKDRELNGIKAILNQN